MLTITKKKPINNSLPDNLILVDTAGFEPVDCKIKRFLLSGQIAQIQRELFDSSDYREMMSDMPVNFEMGDEIEEIKMKVNQITSIRNQILSQKIKKSDVKSELSTSPQAQPGESNAKAEPVDPVGNSDSVKK